MGQIGRIQLVERVLADQLNESYESWFAPYDPFDLFDLLDLFDYSIIFAAMNAKDDLQQRWWNLEAKLVERFGKKPDLETILFLIGVQEFGDIKEKFTKEQKQDLMHIAVCSLFSHSGYYELEGVDVDGWPHFKQLKAMPDMNAIEQENFLKDHVLLYFETNNI